MPRGPSCDLTPDGDPIAPHYVADAPNDPIATSYQLADVLCGDFDRGVPHYERRRPATRPRS